MTQKTQIRSGGRSARRAARSAPLAAHLRPIRPGLEGGQYSPLTAQDVDRIHHAALDALETIGLADAPPSGVACLTGAGAVQGNDGRIRFPRGLVEDAIASANRSITLHGRDPRHDLDPQEFRGVLADTGPVDKGFHGLLQAVLPQAGPALIEVLGDLRAVGVVELPVQEPVHEVEHL